jgi:hypothetical protein
MAKHGLDITAENVDHVLDLMDPAMETACSLGLSFSVLEGCKGGEAYQKVASTDTSDS